MAYAVIGDVQKILKTGFFTYPNDIDDEVEWAEARIDSKLAGVYALKFDDTGEYASVPVEINWITALLVAYRLWDGQTVLEGQRDDTAADKWHEEAMDWLTCIKAGDCRLSLADGTLIDLPTTTLVMRSYPDGVRTKADSADNDPKFTRADVW